MRSDWTKEERGDLPRRARRALDLAEEMRAADRELTRLLRHSLPYLRAGQPLPPGLAAQERAAWAALQAAACAEL